MWWLIILLAALLLLLGVILVRTLRFTPPAERIPEAQPVSVDGKKATEHLAAMMTAQSLKSSGSCCQSSIHASMKRANVSTSGAMAFCSAGRAGRKARPPF